MFGNSNSIGMIISQYLFDTINDFSLALAIVIVLVFGNSDYGTEKIVMFDNTISNSIGMIISHYFSQKSPY